MIRTIKERLGVLLSVMLLCGLVVVSSCGGEDEPQLTVGDQVFLDLVKSPWKVTSVTVDGVDRTSLFTNFTLTLTPSSVPIGKPTSFNGSYATTNGGPVWPAIGSWVLADPAVGSSINRSDAVQIQLSQVSATSFTMSLAWNKTTYGTGGRVESIQGQHVFVMGK